MQDADLLIPEQGNYDYIIAGAGCAGLSLAIHLIHSGQFTNKKVLIIDREEKQRNDRTWSFWETEPGLFETIVYRRWKHTWFHSENFSGLLDLSPYEYKMIRGIDFYTHCFDIIRQQLNFEIKYGDIKSFKNESNRAVVQINEEIVSAEFIFNSILFEKPVLKNGDYYLLQHFKGWIIETDFPVFNPAEAILMDFRTGQDQGSTFVYVKPFSEKKALIEYTLFSEKLLESSQYDDGLKDYIQRILKIQSYKIIEEESGSIPMTNYKFPAVDGRIINIGTAGGQTKASSGYTFRFIQKHSERLVENLVKRGNPFIVLPGGPARFRFYDSTLLHILTHRKLPGDKIFTTLFKKNKPQQVLRFLDNESTLLDELKIISSLPTLPFLKAAMKQF